MRHSVQTVQRNISRFRTDSIRNQILLFAVLATLVPSLVTAVIAYTQNRRALTEKISQELVTAGKQSAREVDVWLKEHLQDLRVFASSYLVSENLTRGSAQRARLADYLSSVQTRFGDYTEIQAVDAQGRMVASGARAPREVQMPADWIKSLQTSAGFVGDPYWDPEALETVVTLGVQVDRRDGGFAGSLVARTSLKTLGEQLVGFSDATSGNRVYLVTGDGRMIADSRTGTASDSAAQLSIAAVARLAERDGQVTPYRGPDGTDLVGSARRVGRATWLAIADVPEAEAYAQVARLRNVTFGVVSLLLAVVGLIAYRLGLFITRPLEKLTKAAAQVTAGNLTVGLPEAGGGEVGYLTQIFNDMVGALRTHQAELERLSTTDSLTGLVNRRHLISTLAEEAQRARRYNRGFAVLMVDVDHFKAYNDTFGHPAGDEVLRQVAAILKECTRANDCAARYGGEEFLVMLSETPIDGALQVAERIRSRMSQQGFDGKKVTLSIGLARFLIDGDTPDTVISAADAALYEAKRAGRNRVIVAGQKRKSVSTTSRTLSGKPESSKTVSGTESTGKTLSGREKKKKPDSTEGK